MAAQVVYENVRTTTSSAGSLFAGKSFWLSHRTPSRSTYVERIKSNGGALTSLEDSADVKIGDHMRPKFSPLGSISYEYIDACLSAGRIVDSGPHLIHPNSELRSIGSTSLSAKPSRARFTAEDDRILLEWVAANSEGLAGNKIYTQLALKHPQHTWQSWRDRFVKGRTIGKPQAPTNEVQEAITLQTDTTRQLEPSKSISQPKQPSSSNVEPKNVDREEYDDESVTQNTITAATIEAKQTPLFLSDDDDEAEPSEAEKYKDAESPTTPSAANEETDSRDRALVQNESRIKDMAGESRDISSSLSPSKDQIETTEDYGSGLNFSAKDFDELLNGGRSIMSVHPEWEEEAWASFAERWPGHTSDEWRRFWHEHVRPVYLRQKQQRLENGEPSASEESDLENDEALYDRKDASPGLDNSVTTPTGSGIEILADDGERHISTPVRHRGSPERKRKIDTHAAEPSRLLSGERVALKRRRLGLGKTTQQQSGSQHVEDSDADEDLIHSNSHYQTATGRAIDMDRFQSHFRKGSNEASISSQSSLQYETAKLEPDADDADVESIASIHLKPFDTQNDIDAQIQLEMSSAAVQERPKTQKPPLPSSTLDVPDATPGNAHWESEEDSESEVIRVRTVSPKVHFAPAALVPSPGGTPSLLPPFPSLGSKPENNSKRRPRTRSEDVESNTLIPSPANSQTSSPLQLLETDLPNWISYEIEAGASPEQVKLAIKASNGELELAETVLREVTAGRPVPRNIRGIWTAEDDNALQSGGERSLISVLKKHGRKAMDNRRDFLSVFDGTPQVSQQISSDGESTGDSDSEGL